MKMKHPEFCPFCGAMKHKLMIINEPLFFCKECNKFFDFESKEFRCPKCNSPNLEDSDFPSPDGDIIIHCRGCRKMFTTKELIGN